MDDDRLAFARYHGAVERLCDSIPGMTESKARREYVQPWCEARGLTMPGPTWPAAATMELVRHLRDVVDGAA